MKNVIIFLKYQISHTCMRLSAQKKLKISLHASWKWILYQTTILRGMLMFPSSEFLRSLVTHLTNHCLKKPVVLYPCRLLRRTINHQNDQTFALWHFGWVLYSKWIRRGQEAAEWSCRLEVRISCANKQYGMKTWNVGRANPVYR